MDSASAGQATGEDALFLNRLEQLCATHPRNLCARHLSRDLFMSFSAGERERLRRCCRSGVENPDSLVGCYILRPDDLHTFGRFFGPLIREHHGTSAAALLASTKRHDGADPDDLDLAALGVPVLSTRVRVGRNLAGFPLPASMDRGQRIGLERAMVRALQVLIDDPLYAGQVFSLTPDFGPGQPNPNLIDARQFQDLVDAHIMFRNMHADPYMRSAGLAADWPYGRACYVSADRSVIVWIGEEDHLRIIATRAGAGLFQAYDQLQTVLATIAAIPGVDFVHDDAYGYVTSCPSNLGTSLRASARVTLPGLTKPGVDTTAICRQFGLTASGLAGDRSLTGVDGCIDLSPIRRLFLTDRDILAALVRGLRQLASLRSDDGSGWN